MPGLVTRSGVLRASPNLVGIREFAVGERLRSRLGQPVVIDNDATCALAAEWQFGAAKGETDVVMVTLGTGIGGALVAGDRLIRGVNGFTGEIGHMVVDPAGPPCPCGRAGCWERYASGSGLARLAREAAAGGRLHTWCRWWGRPGGGARRARPRRRAGRRPRSPAGRRSVRAMGRARSGEPHQRHRPGSVRARRWAGPERELYPSRSADGSPNCCAPELRPHPSLRFAAYAEYAGAMGAAVLPLIADRLA
ncbi:MAG: ROK family protein [Ilumatobacteraceae bacterium]